ncbi:UNVERIFIED_CONTAM: protein GLE1 [Sesamum calycinum]|uniref:mRNA export factor GLE1 n=1 Tax=Sesamum calycinum TaxID=2727403 RepID=A0AAW2PSA5_9LAMI
MPLSAGVYSTLANLTKIGCNTDFGGGRAKAARPLRCDGGKKEMNSRRSQEQTRIVDPSSTCMITRFGFSCLVPVFSSNFIYALWGAVKLELRSPQNVNGIAADPQPDWSFDNLLSELDAIDKKLDATIDFPVPFTKTQPRKLRASKDSYRGTRGFIMHVPDHEIDYTDDDSEEEADYSTMVSGRRFACDELYMSDDSENEMPLQCHLMDKVGVAEGALHELTHELQLSVSDYHRHGQHIGRQIKTISATVENVRTRAEELVKLINSSGCPQSISIQLFAEKIVSNCTNQRSSNAIFATSRVIVLVTSKIPLAMDVLIAELNRVCIYTVPKHISYSEDVFKTKDAYFKAIGYEEENGKIESIDDYVERLSCYMKLYGAIVQTEVGGFQNLHGLREGWAWLARFLNSLPANLYTAVALHSFLEMAGFTLYRRYRNQFEKLLHIVARDFLNALKEGGSESWSAKLSKVKMSIRDYIESNQFKKEPEGLQLRGHLESNDFY